jgi:predicted nucleic acid-binding protein
LITKENYQQASELTKEIDPDDVLFVGLSIQLRCKLWSGDKRLLTGLSNKGYNRIMTTEELFKLYLLKEIKHQRH